MEKESTFRESGISTSSWDVGQNSFSYKGVSRIFPLTEQPPRLPPRAAEQHCRSEPCLPQGQPRLWGRSQGAGPWPAAETWAGEQVSFVLQYYANKQIKLSTWAFFLIKGFD